MSTLAKQVMDFIRKHKHNLTEVGFDEDTAWWEWKDGAEAKINEFLEAQQKPVAPETVSTYGQSWCVVCLATNGNLVWEDEKAPFGWRCEKHKED